MAGIPDPMRQLPTLYSLLDAVEVMVLDSMEKQEDRDTYFIRTYAPPHGSSLGATKLPKGWEAEDEMEAFSTMLDSDSQL